MTAKDPKYHLLKPIIIQGFIAQVLTLFYTAMQKQGYLPNATSNGSLYK
jgi:hypothetical protein